MPGGRPTKFRKEYCEMLLEHMKQGFSYESFGGRIGVSPDTCLDWEQAHPEFLLARKIGYAMCRLWWEEAGIDGMTSGSINASIWIFNMKNRFKWRDVEPEDLQTIAPTIRIALKKEPTTNLLKMLMSQKQERPTREVDAISEEA